MKNKFTIHRTVLKILLGLVIVSAICFIGFVALQVSGKNRLYKRSENKKPDLASVEISWDDEEDTEESVSASSKQPILIVEEDSDNWEEGDIRYKGVHYRYNDQVLTFLVMGIDKKGTATKASKKWDEGGQSDAMFLLVLNPKKKEASLIAINRNTMTDIDIYSSSGLFLMTAKGQITLQHAYGDGKEISCERSLAVVSKLFYNLPIHGYCAINLDAIPKINDAVGGVDLVALEDIKTGDKVVIKEGKQVHLNGKLATLYVQKREVDSFNSASRRLERQKQYLSAYADQAKAAVKKDITVLVSLYNTISKYMVTDITVDEVSYFSTQIGDYQFDSSRIYSMAGETVMGTKFEEFYVDEKALYELILKVFYDVIED